MIKVTRPAAPSVLVRKGEKWLNDLRDARSESEKDRATNKYRHKEIRQTLVQLFHGKCAYCESRITHVDYGHIEHYRPKSGPSARPDLTFDWNNLLLACGACNGAEHKSDKFPEGEEGGPIINPCNDEPTEHFEFRYNRKARLASVYGKTDRGEVTESLLGLNRRALRSRRSTEIQKLFILSKFAPQDSEAAALLQQAMTDEGEYSAFARALFGSNSTSAVVD
jgi:uncharacterized protein (TIGR02646 family)